MKRFLTWLLVALAFGATVFYFHRAEQEREDSARRSEQEKLRTRQEISSFARVNGALSDWRAGLCGGGMYTLDLQNALVRQDRRPVLLIGWLDDVRRDARDSASPAILVFQVELCNDAEVNFELTASSAEAAKALQHRGNLAEYYAVVARCAEVASLPLQPQESRSDNDSEEEQPKFVVKGACLDLRFLGFDAPVE